jgi:uncharacterized protein (DUF58 family)
MRAQAASAAEGSPVRVELGELLRLKPRGEALRLASRKIHALGSGGHLSMFKGRGVEFDEARPYQPGDDLRSIDWRVTARTGKPHTKVFREERNRPVIVWLDLRAPMMFATRGAYKAVRAAEMAALIAWSAIGNGDRFGGLVFAEREHQELRPMLGQRAALRFLQQMCRPSLWQPPPLQPSANDAELALARLTRVARPGSLVFLLSDFRNLGSDFAQRLRQLASRAEVFLVHFYDPLEAELPPPGRYRIAQVQRSMVIDTASREARIRYAEQFARRRATLAEMARLRGLNWLECTTTQDPWTVLGKHFGTR